jgi:hypothetical protein
MMSTEDESFDEWPLVPALLVGMEVIDGAGDSLGLVSQILADAQGRRYFEVDVGADNKYVPVEGITSADESSGAIHVQYSKELIIESPAATAGAAHIDVVSGEGLRHHYGGFFRRTDGRDDQAATNAGRRPGSDHVDYRTSPWSARLAGTSPGPDPGSDDTKPWGKGS